MVSQRTTSNFNNSPRLGNYWYPQINNVARPFLHNNDRNMLRGLRPSALTSKPPRVSSPYSCKFCSHNKISNAYHCHKDCPFKNQNINWITNSNATDTQITPEVQSEQSSSGCTNNTYWHLLATRHFIQNGSKFTAKSQYAVKNVSSGEIIPCLIDTGSKWLYNS